MTEEEEGPEEREAPAEAPAGSGQMDPWKSVQIFISGKKGYGKTELAYHLFDGFPFDRMAIDPNGDLKMPEDTLELEAPLPSRWPGELYRQTFPSQKRKRQTVRFRPDAGTAEYREEMDRAGGLAFADRRTALFFDECHEGAPAGQTPPHMRRALRHGRHADRTLILATPRPMTIHPLCISAADTSTRSDSTPPRTAGAWPKISDGTPKTSTTPSPGSSVTNSSDITRPWTSSCTTPRSPST